MVGSKVSRGRQRKQRASARAQARRVPWTVESLVWVLMLHHRLASDVDMSEEAELRRLEDGDGEGAASGRYGMVATSPKSREPERLELQASPARTVKAGRARGLSVLERYRKEEEAAAAAAAERKSARGVVQPRGDGSAAEAEVEGAARKKLPLLVKQSASQAPAG